MSESREQKISCGGFYIGEGLEMEGKTLKATGGGGGLYMNTVNLEFDDDVDVAGNCYINFVSSEKINNIDDVFNFLFSHIDNELCWMPATGTGFLKSVGGGNQRMMVDCIRAVDGENGENGKPSFLIYLMDTVTSGYGSVNEVYVPVDGEGWFNNCYISSVKI